MGRGGGGGEKEKELTGRRSRKEEVGIVLLVGGGDDGWCAVHRGMPALGVVQAVSSTSLSNMGSISAMHAPKTGKEAMKNKRLEN